ncbi:MAG: PAS domain-containing protein [Hyphomicrobiaceae bacterium]|nr:PAS domain-containing protein [Hyphomicrobiaceae bacterium]
MLRDVAQKHSANSVSTALVELPAHPEDAWIDVIQKMDQVYADLVHSQTQLETKNAMLEEAQAFIDSVLSAMTDVLIVCDVDGRIQRVNKALETTTGKSNDSLMGCLLSDLFESTTFDPIEKFRKKVKLKQHLADCEVDLKCVGGPGAPLAMNCTPRYDHKGRLVGIVLVGRPVGELRRAYQELDEAHRRLTQTQQQLIVSEKMAALGRLVAGVAHELNNPISFVFGNMHALKRYGAAITEYLSACDRHVEVAELKELREKLRIDHVMRDITPLVEGTLEGAERVSDIVQDLRRFSSNQEEPLEPFDVGRLVRTAADWVVKAERLKPAIELDVPEKLEIVGRRGVIHQIIVNLVQNAVDVLAGKVDGKIWIAARVEAHALVIEVADNGTGIGEEHFDKIFEPFFTTKAIGQGTGLGLYVSYGMALKQGGNLTAANNLHGGATFTLTVPVDERIHK